MSKPKCGRAKLIAIPGKGRARNFGTVKCSRVKGHPGEHVGTYAGKGRPIKHRWAS